MGLHEYTQEVVDYLVKKLPDANPATLCEIAEFFTMKTNNYTSDMIAKNSEQWTKQIQRNDEFYIEFIKRCNK